MSPHYYNIYIHFHFIFLDQRVPDSNFHYYLLIIPHLKIGFIRNDQNNFFLILFQIIEFLFRFFIPNATDPDNNLYLYIVLNQNYFLSHLN